MWNLLCCNYTGRKSGVNYMNATFLSNHPMCTTFNEPIDFLTSVNGSICKHLALENNTALKRLFYLLGSQFSL